MSVVLSASHSFIGTFRMRASHDATFFAAPLAYHTMAVTTALSAVNALRSRLFSRFLSDLSQVPSAGYTRTRARHSRLHHEPFQSAHGFVGIPTSSPRLIVRARREHFWHHTFATFRRNAAKHYFASI